MKDSDPFNESPYGADPGPYTPTTAKARAKNFFRDNWLWIVVLGAAVLIMTQCT